MPSQANGYQREKVTHMEVGLEILKNDADIGVGIEYVADLLFPWLRKNLIW